MSAPEVGDRIKNLSDGTLEDTMCQVARYHFDMTQFDMTQTLDRKNGAGLYENVMRNLTPEEKKYADAVNEVWLHMYSEKQRRQQLAPAEATQAAAPPPSRKRALENPADSGRAGVLPRRN